MELFAYLIKVNLAIILLYGFYRLLLQNDTFFKWKRALLLGILFVSLLYPFWDISRQLIENKMLTEAIRNGAIFPTYYLQEITITADAARTESSFSFWKSLPDILTIIYFLGTLLFLIGVFTQLASIVRMLLHTEPVILSGRKVYIKKGLKAPFSFFKFIIMDPNQYDDSELREILQHEETHVREWHSIDMLLSEVMCVLCWFNPFIWLMRREIRINLEYLADRSVINSGCNLEHYQFHLLRLSYQKPIVHLTNNFNVSPLKKRIFMMNKKQTSLFGYTKYALFIPLVAVLLVFNSMDISSSTREVLEMEPVMGSPDSELNAKIQALETKDSGNVYKEVDEMPEYPGGVKALLQYLQDNIIYPVAAQTEGIQGRVVVRYIVRSTGKIDDIEVLRSLSPECDEEAVRVVKAMPDWTPGKKNGKTVDVYYTLPIVFKLE